MRALIVDDSRFLRERLKQMLQSIGWECAEAANGAEAFEVLKTSGPFELMLLDLNMPEMGGMECVRRLREENLAPSMQVMVVTTEVDSSFIWQALEYGANEFLMKPFTPDGVQGKLLLLGLAAGQRRQARVA